MDIDMRPINPGDLELICRHRMKMFREAGRSESDLALMLSPFRGWLEAQLAHGAYFGFVVQEVGQVIAGVGLMLIDWPPHPSHPLAASRGYVLNLFVEPQWRGRGVGRALMDAADAEFRRRGTSFVVLHSTGSGRPLYERMGWQTTSEMSRTLAPVTIELL